MRVTSPGYLRFPHVHDDLLTFVAEDDVWLAPVEGGRAWRLTSDGAQVTPPPVRQGRRPGRLDQLAGRRPRGLHRRHRRRHRDAPHLLGRPPHPGRRLDQGRRGPRGLPAGQPGTQYSWAYAVPLDSAPRRLPFGQVTDLAVEESGTALLTGRMGGEPAYWKRYRGGTAAGWVATADDPLFTRVLSHVNGQFAAPMLVGEGWSSSPTTRAPATSTPARSTAPTCAAHRPRRLLRPQPRDRRHAVVYHVAGDVDPGQPGAPSRASSTSGSRRRPALARQLVTTADHLGGLDCDETGQASVVEVRGTVHWLTHTDGPARALSVTADARAREARVLGTTGKVVWVTNAGGVDALEIAVAWFAGRHRAAGSR